MRRFGFVVGMLALGLACSGVLATQEERDNARACQEWVDHMNGLDCITVSYDATEMCQGADVSPAEMAPYFDCVREHAACEEGVLVNDVSGCRQPTM